mmetsp:Transcript_27799/g.50226  ORF Transcript_27799/g.50226 Transcript_27799/m.50226 type:complete len:1278 (+) Transcript_27799:42-3875(+)
MAEGGSAVSSSLILHAVPVPVLALDANCRVTDLNQAALQLFSFKQKSDLLEKDLVEQFVSDEDRAETRVNLKHVCEGAASLKTIKATVVTRTGRKPVVIEAGTGKDAKGRPCCVIITVQELADLRALAGQTLADKGGAEHLSGALEASNLALCCINLKGKVVEWTSKMKKLTGLQPAQAQDMDFIDCITALHQDAAKESMNQALRGQTVARFSIEVASSSGKASKVAWLSITPWRSDSKTVVGALAVFEDAEEADKRVGEAQWITETNSHLLDTANAMIFSLDSKQCITEWNHLLADCTGKAKHQVVGKEISQFLGKGSQAFAEAFQIALDAKLGPPVEISLEPDLRLVVGMSTQFNYAGKPVGVLGIAHILPYSAEANGPDATTEDAPIMNTKGMVMHEIRSPLHGIIGLSNTLSQDQGPMKKPLTMIGHSAERVLDLVTNLMDYWNFNQDPVRAPIDGDTVDLATLAKEVISRIDTLKDKRGKPLVKPKVTLESKLDHVVVSGEASSLQQLMHHLVVNALKFTDEGHVKLTLSSDNQEQAAVIKVEDTGIGIHEDFHERIWLPFQQQDPSESRKYDGIGLGLAIVHEVLRIHSGSYKLKSSDKGTEIEVTIPIAAAARDAGGKKAASVASDSQAAAKMRLPLPASLENCLQVQIPPPGTQPRGAPSNWLGTPVSIGLANAVASGSSRAAVGTHASFTCGSLPTLYDDTDVLEDDQELIIMSVDDDFVNQEVMKSILEPVGFKIIPCMSGSECLEYLDGPNTEKPHLMLLDLMMPGLSGFDVLTALAKKYAHGELPIIMVSAKNQSSSVVEGYELGCADWVHKPFCRQELIVRVKSHLKTRRALLRTQLALPLANGPNGSAKDFKLVKQTSQQDKTEPTSSSDTTTLFVCVASHNTEQTALVSLFETFERLSEQHRACRTEILGSSYVAVAETYGDDTQHTDRMLQLALAMLKSKNDADPRSGKFSLKIGLHTDNNAPPSLAGAQGVRRQYPMNCLFSDTVCMARQLSDMAADDRVILSRGSRCRLSSDLEADLQQNGLQVLASASETVGQFYFIAVAHEINPQPMKEVKEDKALPLRQRGPNDGQALQETQLALKEAQEELVKNRSDMTMVQQKLKIYEQQALEARHEAQLLKDRIQQSEVQKTSSGWAVDPPATPDLASTKGNSSNSASQLFLQWQNAHLQTDVRHLQQALAAAKADVQMQVMTCQHAESKQAMLQARIDHLELDLGFKAALNGGAANLDGGSEAWNGGTHGLSLASMGATAPAGVGRNGLFNT